MAYFTFMNKKDILVKNPFGNHTMLSSLEAQFEKVKSNRDEFVSEVGPGSTSMTKDDWLKATANTLKKFKQNNS